MEGTVVEEETAHMEETVVVEVPMEGTVVEEKADLTAGTEMAEEADRMEGTVVVAVKHQVVGKRRETILNKMVAVMNVMETLGAVVLVLHKKVAHAVLVLVRIGEELAVVNHQGVVVARPFAERKGQTSIQKKLEHIFLQFMIPA